MFYGYLYKFNIFIHKVINCRRVKVERDENFKYKRYQNFRSQKFPPKNRNSLSPLMDDVECFKCNNFRYKAIECIIHFEYASKSQYAWKPDFPKDKKSWKRKADKTMECQLSLSTHDQEGRWYIDSRCSKNMTRDNSKFLSLKEKDKGNNVTFGNNAPTRLKQKGTVSLDENTKAQNVLYVKGYKKKLLSESHVCDNGYNLTFRSKYYEI